MKTIFVTGSDTDVGKTTVAGGLLRMLEGYRQAAYWKPVQTGTLISDDQRDLMTLTQLPESRFLPSTARQLRRPPLKTSAGIQPRGRYFESYAST